MYIVQDSKYVLNSVCMCSPRSSSNQIQISFDASTGD